MAVEFTTIPEAEMIKPKQTSKLSAEVLQTRKDYDNILKSLKPGQAGVIAIPEGGTARGIRMNLRYASDRTNHQVVVNKFVVSDDKKAVQFTVGAPKAVPAPVAAQ